MGNTTWRLTLKESQERKIGLAEVEPELPAALADEMAAALRAFEKALNPPRPPGSVPLPVPLPAPPPWSPGTWVLTVEQGANGLEVTNITPKVAPWVEARMLDALRKLAASYAKKSE